MMSVERTVLSPRLPLRLLAYGAVAERMSWVTHPLTGPPMIQAVPSIGLAND